MAEAASWGGDSFAEFAFFNKKRIREAVTVAPEVVEVLVLGYKLGIADGSGACMNDLGALYYMGDLVEQDYVKAAELYGNGGWWCCDGVDMSDEALEGGYKDVTAASCGQWGFASASDEEMERLVVSETFARELAARGITADPDGDIELHGAVDVLLELLAEPWLSRALLVRQGIVREGRSASA